MKQHQLMDDFCRIEDHSRVISPRRWQRPALVALAAVLSILALFHDTVWSMVLVWQSSDTFSYGFLIFPISAWLIWGKRRELTLLSPHPEIWVLGLIMVTGCVWLLSRLLGVEFIEQCALIGVLILVVWSILGTAVAKVLLFPLGFLFFAVPPIPIHDALVLPLMDFTADFTVKMLQLTGVAVYKEGTSFSLSSGGWNVIKACSGIRYLIATASLGCLFAYFTYRSLLRRLLFVGFSMVLPVIANGLRAYIVVMIGHLSEMKLAVGIDHIIYGWLFFGLIIMIMFGIGSIWREPQEEPLEVNKAQRSKTTQYNVYSGKRLIATCLASLLAAAIWPFAAYAISQIQADDNQVNLKVPAGVEGWRIDNDWLWTWWPRVQRVDGEFYKFYSKGDQVVALYVGQFRSQRRGVEMIDSENVVVERGHVPAWLRNRQAIHRSVRLANRNLRVIQSIIPTTRKRTQDWGKLLVWRWYRLGDRYISSNPYVAKWLEVWSRLTGSRRDAALIMVATPYGDGPEASEYVLRSFAENMLPEIEKNLDRSVGEG